MMKKLLCGLIVGVFVSTCFLAYGAEATQWKALKASFKVFVKGKEFKAENPTAVIDGRTYLPLKAVGDALGVDVVWNNDLKRVEVAMTKRIRNSASSAMDITIANSKAKPGDTLVIPVKFENVPTEGVQTLNMSLLYDSSKIEVLSVAPGSIVTNPDKNFNYNLDSDNAEISILFEDDGQKGEGLIKTDGEFIKLTVKIKDDVFNGTESSKMYTVFSVEGSNFADFDLNRILGVFKLDPVEIEK